MELPDDGEGALKGADGAEPELEPLLLLDSDDSPPPSPEGVVGEGWAPLPELPAVALV